MKPPPSSLTGSPQTGILHHQSHWTVYSCTFARVPKKEPHADGRHTYNGKRPGSPRESLKTLLSLPQCHAALGTIPFTLASVDKSPVSQLVSQEPPSGYILHNCYHLPCDPGYRMNLLVLFGSFIHPFSHT